MALMLLWLMHEQAVQKFLGRGPTDRQMLSVSSVNTSGTFYKGLKTDT